MVKFKVVFFALFIFITSSFAQEKKTVKPFLPEIITSLSNVRDIAISADHNEIYFTLQPFTHKVSFIVKLKKTKLGWSSPEIVDFSGIYRDIEPFLSHDGLRLYFSSNRPVNSTDSLPGDYNIWYVERKSNDDKWSNPINIGSPVNSEADEFYPSLGLSGNLYFTAERENTKGKEDIYICTRKKGKYSAPASLNSSINSKGYEFNAFIAPDESFIIFTAYGRKDCLGGGDLYISTKNKEGVWQPARHLGNEINSSAIDYCPFVDKNGVLYFTSKRNALKNYYPKRLNFNDFWKEVNQYENGLERLYHFDLKKLHILPD